jgi:membrane protein required for colicin V production
MICPFFHFKAFSRECGMNLVDILIWVVLLGFAVKGFMKGLVREVCCILGLVIGGWVAFAYCGPVAAAIGPHMHLPRLVLPVLAFGLIFVTIGLFFFFLGYVLTTFFKILLLGTVNRMAGLFLGLLEGALVLSIVLSLAAREPVPERVQRSVAGSASAKPFALCGTELLSWWRPPGQGRQDRAPLPSKRPVRGGRQNGSGMSS